MSSTTRVAIDRHFPRSSGILFGLGLGGFFDGIVFHQLLQWHHMFSAWYPIDSVDNLAFNTFWDGVFHSATYLFLLAGLFIFWRSARRPHFRWSTKELIGTVLTGFGLFNLVEGLVNHQLLGIHHVNETADRSAWLYWDIGFLAWGAVMLAVGWTMIRRRV
ncbi:DUF2243 domain-containing protein [Rhizobium sophoriradicis]|uniref:DUF2243 domain-containing protein n=1 Tax=Rhizobium sophoriradicis TaxID=1535245 RepID=A0A2A5KXL6_9HYPH|nr:DUF2243 domain-containing protein [Rhizobium sophoriradicis]PCK81677.1 hypothetical protein CPT34_07670 [Rhizobium sophoriradicis]